jgi:AcrR family transcriptional regulator
MTDQEIMPTADRLVTAATTLFAEKGYNSTSVADILREAGANSGSFYHAFPTKQDLLLEVLRRYRDGIGPMLLEPAWEGVDEPIERIFALLAAYREMLARSDCLYGCPIGSLALELHEPDPPVRELLAINFDGWTGAIEACLAATPESLPRDASTTRLARFVLTVMEGGVMQSRTHRSLEAFDACVDTLRDYFNRLRDAAKNETKPGETS